MAFAESDTPHAQSPLRLLAVGDCNTGGVDGGDPDDRVSNRFAEQLRSAGVPCRQQNLGYTMSTTREGVLRMQRDAEPADLVVINFGLVDAWVTSLPRIYISYYPDNGGKRLLRKLLKSAKRRLRSPALRRWISTGPVVPLEEYERNLRAMISAARDRNPNVRIILWGTVRVPDDAGRSTQIAAYNDCLRRIADEDPACLYVDSDQVLADLAVDKAYLDRVHLSRQAAELLAAAMAAAYFDTASSLRSHAA